MSRSERYQRIYAVVRQIPFGRVATYGQIASLSGYPGQARQVGYALNKVPDEVDIPWQRVINANGQISPRANPIFEEIQQRILESEGICFGVDGRIDMAKFQWKPGSG